MPFKKNIFFKTTWITVVFAFAAITVSLIVLAGWVFNIKILTSFSPVWRPMKVNTAFGILLSSVSLLLFLTTAKKWLAWCLGIFVFLLGAITLSEFIWNWDARIDELLFKYGNIQGELLPGRMAFAAAIGLSFTGISLMFFTALGRTQKLLSDTAAMIVMIIAFIAFVGYLYNAKLLYSLTSFSSLSFPSSVCLLFISSAILFARPERGFLSVFNENNHIARMGTRQVIYILIILLVMGWLCLNGQLAGFYDYQFGISILMVSFAVIFFFLVRFAIGSLIVVEKIKDKLYLQNEKNAALIKNVFERVNDPFIALDKNWYFTYVNQKGGELVNRNPETLIGKNIWEEFPDTVNSATYLAFNRAMAEQCYLSNTEYYATFDLWHEDFIYPSPEGLSVFIRDITEKKRTEKELEESQAKYSSLVENSSDAILLAIPDGKIIAANRAACTMFGMTEEEICQAGREDLIDSLNPQFSTMLAQRHTTGKTTGELSFFHKNGSKFSGEITSAIFKDANGKERISMIIRDISERKKVENALRTSEFKFRRIFESGLTGLIFWDANGDIYDANDHFLKMVGYSRQDLKEGRINWKNMTPPEYADLDELGLKQVALTGICESYEKEYICKDGTRIPILIGGASIEGNQVEKGIAYIVDISEHKKAEQKIKEAEEIQRLIMNSSLDAIIGIDTESCITIWTAQAEKVFGWKKEDIIGRKISETIIPQDYREKHNKGFAHYLQTGEGPLLNKTIEISALNQKGQEFPIELNITPVKQGGKEFFVAFIKNITERKKTESINIGLSNLSRRLGATNTIQEAGHIIMDLADQLLGWDSCTMELVSEHLGLQKNILRMDVVNGKRTIVPPEEMEQPVTDLRKKIIADGPLLFNNETNNHLPGTNPFGDKSRPSLSLMYVPIRSHANVVGILSIQSYTSHAYKESDLKLFEILANYCGEVIERINIGTELANSELRYRQMIERNLAGIYQTNITGKILTCNDSFAHMLGYSSYNGLLGKDASNLYFSKTDRADFLNRLNKNGKLINHEIILKHKEGAPVILLENCYLQTDPITGEKIIDGVLIDVTERRIAEQKLKESQEKYYSFFDQSADAIFIFNETGHFVNVNTVAASLLGYSKEEFKHLFLSDILFKDDLAANPIRLDLLAAGEHVIRQRVFKRKDGTPVDVEIHSKKLLGGTYLGVVRDITERKKIENKLASSENHLRTIIETEPECIKLLNEKGELLEINPAGLAMLEADNFEQLKGKALLNTISAPYQMAFKNLIQAVFKDKPQTLEFEITGLKGTHRWLETHAVPLKDNDGKIVSLLAVTRDITEKKKHAEELKTSEERFRTLYEENPLMNFTVDEKGKVLSVNKRGADELGYTIDELTGNSVFQVFYKEDHPIVLNQINECISNPNKTFSWTLRKITKSGDTIFVSETGTALLGKNGTYILMIVCENITQRKIAEDALKKSEKNFRDLLEATPDAMVIVNEKGHIMMVNRQAENVFGYNKEELLNQPVAILIPEGFRHNHEKNMKGYITDPKLRLMGKSLDLKAKRKNGTVFPVEISLSPLMTEEGILISAAIRDITERKKAEMELEEAYQSVRHLTEHIQNIREEERTSIAREIHDELGQQLTVMMMDVSWLGKKIGVENEVAHKKINELLGLLDNTVKTVRRISMELRPSVLDDLGLLTALEMHLSEFRKRSGMHTQLTIPKTEPPFTNQVKNGLFRIFQESLTNVARHSGAKKVTVKLEKKNTEVILIIEDDGIGFDQIKVAAKRTLGVLGMKERAAMMGGKYQISGKPGKGTIISVTVPLHK